MSHCHSERCLKSRVRGACACQCETCEGHTGELGRTTLDVQRERRICTCGHGSDHHHALSSYCRFHRCLCKGFAPTITQASVVAQQQARSVLHPRGAAYRDLETSFDALQQAMASSESTDEEKVLRCKVVLADAMLLLQQLKGG